MQANLETAVALLGQGMAGVFAVLAVIALAVALLGRLDRR
ncbi:OadG-related small transporter subunit [Agathobaculum sp.]|nr:OadG-related small transporter subunit [Agathobaculum sp.]MDY3619291.1 OadG-related small transporter subunit [Agathobaculum sp.]